MIVSFTGHRPDKIGGYNLPNSTYISICQRLEALLKEIKPNKAISGAALGIDQWAANICFNLNIPVIFAIPFLGQEKAWPAESQKVYHRLLAKANEVIVVSEGGYAANKMQIRNEWMIDHCDLLIAVWNGSQGGTANCVAYAEKVKREMKRIIP